MSRVTVKRTNLFCPELDVDWIKGMAFLLGSIAIHASLLMFWPVEAKQPDALSSGSFSAPVNLGFVSVVKPLVPEVQPEPVVEPPPVKPKPKPEPKIVEKAPVKVAKKAVEPPAPKPKPQPKPTPKPEPKPVEKAPVQPTPAPPPAAASSATQASQQSGVSEIPVVTKPMFRKPPTPAEYPRQARRRNQEGTVLVEALVDERGDVVQVKVIKSSGFALLDQSAIKAVQSWAFQPSRIGGKATQSRVQVPVLFELRS